MVECGSGRMWSWRVVKKGIMGDGIDVPWCFVLGNGLVLYG